MNGVRVCVREVAPPRSRILQKCVFMYKKSQQIKNIFCKGFFEWLSQIKHEIALLFYTTRRMSNVITWPWDPPRIG